MYIDWEKPNLNNKFSHLAATLSIWYLVSGLNVILFKPGQIVR